MKIFEWTEGRRASGYNKLPLLLLGYGKRPTVPFLGFLDCYLLKYGPGAFVKKHKDSVCVENPDLSIDHYVHYRLNIILKKSKIGGDFICEDHPSNWSLFDRIFLFRSDMCEHSVTQVLEGTRYVFSIGWGEFTKPYKTTTSKSD